MQCACRPVAAVPNKMSDVKLRGDVTKALALCFCSDGLHMLRKLGAVHNRSKAVSNGCGVLAPIAC